VVNFSIADTIEESAVDHVNILFLDGGTTAGGGRTTTVKLKAGTETRPLSLASKHTKNRNHSSGCRDRNQR
jgi:hypothetical protein